MSQLEVTTLRPEEYAEWDAFVGRSPDGCVYAQADYLATLAEATGASYRILAVRRPEGLIGGVGLYETHSRLHGRCAGPRLLLYYHGPVYGPYDGGYPSQRTARDLQIQSALINSIGALRYDSVILKSRASITDVRGFLAEGWQATPAYSYVVPLADLKQQWQRVEGNLRRLIKRCEGEGVTFTEDDDFEAFFHLHHVTLARRGVPTYLPEKAFRMFYERARVAGLAGLQHARLANGTAIASQLVLLGRHAVSHTVCAGMDPNYSRMGASAFLRWRGFEALASRGYRGNDLTDAALNSVTHFKSQLGGTLETALVVHSPSSARARAAAGWERAAHLPRVAAGRVLRALRLRRPA